MKMIDFHVHLFPDVLAEKTLEKLSRTAADEHGNAPYFSDATVRGTLEKMDAWGVDAAVTQHIATSVRSMHKVNDFAASVLCDRLYAFGSVHPDAPDAPEELERIKALGLNGVKLHPDYQEFYVDDSRMAPLYEKMAQLGLPVLFHAGWDPLSPECIHAEPERMKSVVEAYPNLTVIAAHLGGMRCYDAVEKHLLGRKNLYLDTAMTAPYLQEEAQYARILRGHGIERILFATDCPWSTPERELALLNKAGLTEAEMQAVLHGNAEKLLHAGTGMIGQYVEVVMDRPLGSTHPKHPEMRYTVNYGYIPGIFAGDGAEQDAYVLGVDVPLQRFCGKVIAIIRRKDDVEDKWVVAPEGVTFTAQEILESVWFQEKYFDSTVEM